MRKTIHNLRNELRYYKEMVFDTPVEQPFLCKNVNNYCSFKHLNKSKTTRVKNYISELSKHVNPISKKSHYTKRRTERHYELSKQQNATVRHQKTQKNPSKAQYLLDSSSRGRFIPHKKSKVKNQREDVSRDTGDFTLLDGQEFMSYKSESQAHTR